ncbi:Signal transduction histidine-protein kinase/phosphatase DegS [Ferriphaselus amnicola]|uniref:histidine kinase n=1 Tax=Ferriphaselus amnicola TaxID=1188319 RepID=A0A2Z6GF77_9PROT|nr:histidine kinase [Ferriphaselus amnicola]BBE52029.1 Signal transduction histidine-protein kinase/phosphatase DegS [Ferriphaselus amnicola]
MATEGHGHHGERRSDQRLRLMFAQLLDEQEHDRQRIATELHGGIGQVMSLVKITLEAAAAQIEGGSADKAEQSIRWLIPIVVDSLSELRRISTDLRPSILDDLGLLATLTWFFRRLEKSRPDLKIERDVHIEEEDVPAVLRITLFRILQEAVALLLKEDSATSITLDVHTVGGMLVLEVSSCVGDAAVVAEQLQESIDLLSIRERAILYGGKCKLSVEEGNEAQIRVSWSAKALATFAVR